MKNKVHFSEQELDQLYTRQQGAMQPLAYTMQSPVPQMFVVVNDPQVEASIAVRTVTLTPLTWGPYTKAISLRQDDTKLTRVLEQPGAQCVLALPSRNMLRQITICSQRIPAGISETAVARFKTYRSQTVDVPSLEDCPVNFECVVEHVHPYHSDHVVFLRVTGASIDSSLLFWEREEITRLFPTNYADDVVDEQGAVHRRVSLITDLLLCPTFPVAPKQGWYASFDLWMKDLLAEGYLNQEEFQKVAGWFEQWNVLFAELESPQRAQLRKDLTELNRLAVHEQWDDLHTFLHAA